jgi:hypothetical protein
VLSEVDAAGEAKGSGGELRVGPRPDPGRKLSHWKER